MSIIVTGGAGFIGSNIIKALNDRGHSDIVVVDHLTGQEKYKNLLGLKFKQFVDRTTFINNIDKFNIKTVFHQGACTDTTESNGDVIIPLNYEYSTELFNHCIKKDIRLIYASSAAVYNGNQEEKPYNLYGFSKLMFDIYVRRSSERKNVVGLRYFNVYGPGEEHKGRMASVPYHLYNQHHGGNSVQLFKGSDKFIRDFIYIDDIVDINLFFFDNKEFTGIFDCGTGKPRSFQSLGEVVQEKLCAKLYYKSFPKDLEGKYQKYTCANINDLSKGVGYKAEFHTLEEGIGKYYNYLDNKENA